MLPYELSLLIHIRRLIASVACISSPTAKGVVLKPEQPAALKLKAKRYRQVRCFLGRVAALPNADE